MKDDVGSVRGTDHTSTVRGKSGRRTGDEIRQGPNHSKRVDGHQPSDSPVDGVGRSLVYFDISGDVEKVLSLSPLM